MVPSQRSLMCIGPVALAAFDAAITLLGQRAEYWDGYAEILEFNPLAYALLRLHPALFAVGILVWMAVFIVAIHKLPIGLARLVAFSILLGHALGGASWLLQYRFGLLYVLLLFVLARGLDRFIWQRRPCESIRRCVAPESNALE